MPSAKAFRESCPVPFLIISFAFSRENCPSYFLSDLAHMGGQWSGKHTEIAHEDLTGAGLHSYIFCEHLTKTQPVSGTVYTCSYKCAFTLQTHYISSFSTALKNSVTCTVLYVSPMLSGHYARNKDAGGSVLFFMPLSIVEIWCRALIKISHLNHHHFHLDDIWVGKKCGYHRATGRWSEQP